MPPENDSFLATPRLMLRRLREHDLSAFVAYRNDEETARFQSWEVGWTIEGAQQFLDEQKATRWREPGKWLHLAIEHQKSGALCGDIGVRFAADQPHTVEIAITLAPNHIGKGYASEALAGLLQFLFTDSDVHRIFSMSDVRNEQLHRLVKRLGFRHEATHLDAEMFKGSWSTVVVHALLREEWVQRHEHPIT